MAEPRIRPLGDSALRLQRGEGIDAEVHRRVRGACSALERAALRGVVEWVPGYTTVVVHYQPQVVRYSELCRSLEAALGAGATLPVPEARVVTLPVLYGGEQGPDLAFVAEQHQLSMDEVIELHSRPDYLVYMIGFAPGFPYLGGLSERLVTPRLDKPRLSVPKGSVGIGGSQTGVYSVDSPGGWRLIGRTPVPLYDPGQERPSLLQAGDRVRFRAVGAQDYDDIDQGVKSGSYAVERRPVREDGTR